jgi:hypothetical protein
MRRFFLRGIVVDQADRGVVQLPVALHLADQHLPGVTGSDDKNLLAARHDAGMRALDQRPGKQP